MQAGDMAAEGTVGTAVMAGVVEVIGATADVAMDGVEVFGLRLALESGSVLLIPLMLTVILATLLTMLPPRR